VGIRKPAYSNKNIRKEIQDMKKNFLKTMFCSLLVSVVMKPAVAKDSIECPSSVKAGKPLIVNAIIKNENCDSGFTVNKTIVSLIGNSGTSGSSGLQGPFIKNLTTPIVVPKATCEEYCNPYDNNDDGIIGDDEQNCSGYFFVTDKGSAPLDKLQIIAKVPTGMKNQLASAVVAVLDSNKKIHTVGACLVEVTK
jgi:hypothetical protein